MSCYQQWIPSIYKFQVSVKFNCLAELLVTDPQLEDMHSAFT
jgi:hypothetical protein